MRTGSGILALRPESRNLYRSLMYRMIHAQRPTAGPAQDAAAREFSHLTLQGAVARVDVVGILMKDLPDWILWIFEGMVSDTRRIQRAVEAAAADPEIETIILRIDSPGGSVDGVDEAAAAIKAAAAVKPVIAQIDGTGASAAYYLASQAGEIRLGVADVVGSIGVISELYDYSKNFEQAGVEAVPIATSPFKWAGMEGTELTPEHRAEFQRLIDQWFEIFKGRVQAGRGLSELELAAVADARVWIGQDAVRMKLADKVATLDDTLRDLQNEAAQRAAGRARTARAQLRVLGAGA